MRRTSRGLVVVACLTLGAAGGYLASSTVPEVRAEVKIPAIPRELTSYRDIVKTVVPAVVSIESRAKGRRPIRVRPGDDQNRSVEIGFGSGVVVDAKGVVLTNYHVVEGADFVEVRLTDGRKFTSKDIVGDRKTDLAIVRIQVDQPIPALEFGDSDEMEVGDRVLAVGAPFGLTGSVTHGIISAKSRNLKLNVYEDFLQTDAAINPGNSGGPLVNLDGRLIGINSAIKSRSGGFQGVGLAISSNLVKAVMQQLLKDGAVHRGYLGVQIREIDVDLAAKLKVAEKSGVQITRIFGESPAAKGGLKAGDVVTKIGEKMIRSGADLQKVVTALPVGKLVDVAVLREGETVTAKVTVEEQPEDYGLRDPDE